MSDITWTAILEAGRVAAAERKEERARLRALVEAKHDDARLARNAAPLGSQAWILNAGRAVAYGDVLALLGGDDD